jgi:hypothetical protein
MTINATTARQSYVCNGVTTLFAVNIQAYAAADFLVLLTNTSTGVVTTLVLNSDYTLVSSGTLAPTYWNLTTLTAQFTSPYATGYTLQVILNPVETQTTSYVQGEAFPSLAVQTNLDRVTQMAIRLSDQVGRALRAPDGDVSPAMILPSAAVRANLAPLFDGSGNITLGVIPTTALTQTIFNTFLALSVPYVQTAAEIAAGVTPTNYAYLPGDVRRYGADPTGVADSTSAITNALAVHAGNSVHAPAGTYKCTSPITITGATLLYGDGMGVTTFAFNNPNANQFVTTGNECNLRDFTITITGVGTSSSVAAVNINASDYCKINRIEVIGASWVGIGIYNASSHNLVEACYIHGGQGTVQDAADIQLGYQTGNTDYNIIRDNYCLGGTETGIHILGNTNVNPQYNLIVGNRIGQHTTYGILDYRNSNGLDAFNQIIGNYIENIQGTTRSGASGAGIYNAGAGGDLIQGNVVRNCCVQTTIRSLIPAAIGVSGTNTAKVNIIGNVIEGMTAWDGICIASCPPGANVVGNTIRMPINTTGTAAINIANCSNVVVSDNGIDIVPITGTTVLGIQVSQAANQSNVIVSNNRITGGNSAGISLFTAGGFTLTGFTVSGNILTGSGGGGDSISCPSLLAGGAIVGNYVNTTTNKPLALTANCSDVRISNNILLTTGTYSFYSAGTNTRCYFDKTNSYNQSLLNSGTGTICEQLSNVTPGAGSAAIGDRVEQSVPVVGNPKGWRCTVAGSPGTWVSEGNL